MAKQTRDTDNDAEKVTEKETAGKKEDAKSFFKNLAASNAKGKAEEIDALTVKLEESEAKAKEYWERILRMQAENDNMLRRIERDVSNAHKYALEKFVAELIPIVDSLELCLTSVPQSMQESAASILEGVNLTLKMFYTAMEKFGIKQVNPESQPFDPEYEQAISMQVDTSVPAGTVISVLQKGYTLNNRLVRPALVIVSKAEE